MLCWVVADFGFGDMCWYIGGKWNEAWHLRGSKKASQHRSEPKPQIYLQCAKILKQIQSICHYLILNENLATKTIHWLGSIVTMSMELDMMLISLKCSFVNCHDSLKHAVVNMRLFLFFWGCVNQCRWNACGTCKSSFHGWDLLWAWQLYHVPNCEVFAPISTCFGWNYACFPSPTSTRDLCTLWWSHTALWRPNCLSRSMWFGSWFLWDNGFQVSTKKRDCRLLTRGR